MPFVTQEKRRRLDGGYEATEPGDRCYVYYKSMVELWKAEPRWTTAHYIYKDMKERYYSTGDDRAAAELAWQVFFQLHVMPYELRKREENGDI